jgi:hypothetical protein
MNHSAKSFHNPDRGLTVHDLLMLPDEQRRVLNWMQRHTPCSLRRVSSFLNRPDEYVFGLLDSLCQRGYVNAISTEDETLYEVYLTSMRQRRYQGGQSNFFDALTEDVDVD